MTDVVMKLHSALLPSLDGKTKYMKVEKYSVALDRGIKPHPLKMLHILGKLFGTLGYTPQMPTVYTDYGSMLTVLRIKAYVECEVGGDTAVAQEYKNFFGKEAFVADYVTLKIGDGLTSEVGDLFAYHTDGFRGYVGKASIDWNADNPKKLDITFDFFVGVRLNIL